MDTERYLRHVERKKPGFGAHLSTMAIIGLISPLQRYEVSGPGAIPAEGPAIVAANHISYIDPVILNAYIYRQRRVPYILTKASLFKVPIAGAFLRAAHAIPLGRKGDDKRAMEVAVRLLERGELLMIFPEGTSAKDEERWPMRAKTGAAWLSLESGVPITPIAQWGAEKIVTTTPRGTTFHPFPLRKKVSLRIGEPVDLSSYREEYRSRPGQALRKAADATMSAITRGLEVIRDRPALGPYAAEPAASV